ncbi:hypothetical protein LB503_012387 [Fusarium chuoi]|nr:hypothetical protein LB503_012387 [Fusarium chuoi]
MLLAMLQLAMLSKLSLDDEPLATNAKSVVISLMWAHPALTAGSKISPTARYTRRKRQDHLVHLILVPAPSPSSLVILLNSLCLSLSQIVIIITTTTTTSISISISDSNHNRNASQLLRHPGQRQPSGRE